MPHFRNISQYDARGRQMGYIDSAEASRLMADGSHEWRCVSCGKAKGEGPCLVARNHTMAVFEVEIEAQDDADQKPGTTTDCTLTMRDMERNVGITEGDPGGPPAVNLMVRARRRIRHQASASLKNRAITVVPRDSLDWARRQKAIAR